MLSNGRYYIVNREAIEAHDISNVMLLWSDVPYGTGRVQSQGANRFKDGACTEYVLDSIASWLPRMSNDGTVAICLDYRLAPQMVNRVIREGWYYRSEIIWEFGLGRPRMSWWPVRHNNILTFTKTETSGKFDPSAIPKAKRLAPKPGYADTKPSGSVWDFTMSNTHPDRVGYPNQKPVEIIEPFILAHTVEGDIVADPFCGSSSTGVAALKHGRSYYGCDTNPNAILISNERLREIV